MKIAVIGSGSSTASGLGKYIPPETTEIVLGREAGIYTSAKEYAALHGITLTELFPGYEKYGQDAPLKHNLAIIENADLVVALWDGKNLETKSIIDRCNEMGVPIRVFV